MPQGEHFAVYRIHLLNCSLHQGEDISTCGRSTWRGESTNQLNGHRRRGRLRIRDAVEANLAGGIPFLGTEVLPVEVDKCLIHNHAQPDERGGCGTVGIMFQALACGHESLLQHVIRPQPPA